MRKQLAANPVQQDPGEDLARHREECNTSVVVALTGITLSLPDGDNDALSPVGRDDPRVPHGTNECMQPLEDALRPRVIPITIPIDTPIVVSS